ncbi:MAG: FAD:protein FMN transferase [Roseivivax sp.]|nr:FAD:protein FMN transferase [Roseivivax sp.]
MSRRRFLKITAAAALASPATAGEGPAVWHGRALGADVQLRVTGLSPERAALLWPRVARLLERIEASVSLFRPSELTRLNETGLLAHPGEDMRALCDLSARLHAATGGAFDPSVQPLWRALAQGSDIAAARARIGWQRVEIGTAAIRLEPGAALTFNGVAQGYAADRVAALLRAQGLREVLVDTGEIVATGRRWPVTIAAPDGTPLAQRDLRNRALATSSPAATRVGPTHAAHILHPGGQAPLWQTVSVSAPSAALADGLSTAFCLMPREGIDAALARFAQARLEYLV